MYIIHFIGKSLYSLSCVPEDSKISMVRNRLCSSSAVHYTDNIATHDGNADGSSSMTNNGSSTNVAQISSVGADANANAEIHSSPLAHDSACAGESVSKGGDLTPASREVSPTTIAANAAIEAAAALGGGELPSRGRGSKKTGAIHLDRRKLRAADAFARRQRELYKQFEKNKPKQNDNLLKEKKRKRKKDGRSKKDPGDNAAEVLADKRLRTHKSKSAKADSGHHRKIGHGNVSDDDKGRKDMSKLQNKRKYDQNTSSSNNDEKTSNISQSTQKKREDSLSPVVARNCGVNSTAKQKGERLKKENERNNAEVQIDTSQSLTKRKQKKKRKLEDHTSVVARDSKSVVAADTIKEEVIAEENGNNTPLFKKEMNNKADLGSDNQKLRKKRPRHDKKHGWAAKEHDAINDNNINTTTASFDAKTGASNLLSKVSKKKRKGRSVPASPRSEKMTITDDRSILLESVGVLRSNKQDAHERFLEKQRQMYERLQQHSQRKEARRAKRNSLKTSKQHKTNNNDVQPSNDRSGTTTSKRVQIQRKNGKVHKSSNKKSIKSETTVREENSAVASPLVSKKDKAVRKVKKKKKRRRMPSLSQSSSTSKTVKIKEETNKVIGTNEYKKVIKAIGTHKNEKVTGKGVNASLSSQTRLAVAPFIKPIGSKESPPIVSSELPKEKYVSIEASAVLDRLKLNLMFNMLPQFFPLKKRLRYLSRFASSSHQTR